MICIQGINDIIRRAKATFDKVQKSLGLHCHLLRINSKPRSNTTTSLLDDDVVPNEPDADPMIRELWQQTFAESAMIESRLQTHANNLTSTAASESGLSTHTRSSSVSSNLSNNTGLQSLSNTQPPFPSPSPLELSNVSLESSTSVDHIATPDIMQGENATSSSNVQYGRYLTADDVTSCKAMVREFVVQSLVPFMERNIQHWNEQVASARRGLTGRLFGASRRLFGSSSRTHSSQSLQTIPATGPNVPAGVNQVVV